MRNCYKECVRCHRPFPSDKYFQLSDIRCNSCTKKYLKEKAAVTASIRVLASPALSQSKMSEEESMSDSNNSIVEVPSPVIPRRAETLANQRKRKEPTFLETSDAENDNFLPSIPIKKKKTHPILGQAHILERPLAEVAAALPKRRRKAPVKKNTEGCKVNELKQKTMLQSKICDLVDKWCEKHKALDNSPKMGLVPIIFP